MKNILLIAFACGFIFAMSCTRNKRPPIGGGYAVTCICKKDTATRYFPLGNDQTPHTMPYYQDSCNKLNQQVGFDTGIVAILAL
jgi:hypothetical protein